jgi:hypothetical protein
MSLNVRIGNLITDFQSRADRQFNYKISESRGQAPKASIGPFDDVTAYMSTIPRGVFKDLDAYLEPQNVIPITPISIESVTPPPFQIFSPHLGADRHQSAILINCTRHAYNRCGKSYFNPVTQQTSKRTTKVNAKIETDKVRIGKK